MKDKMKRKEMMMGGGYSEMPKQKKYMGGSMRKPLMKGGSSNSQPHYGEVMPVAKPNQYEG